MINRPVFILLAAAISVATVARAEVYDTLEQAQQDPDFALQGEYIDAARGLQAIAMGEGTFRVVIYTGGLPGAGWNGKEKQTIEIEEEQLASLLRQFQRVERESPTLGLKPPAGAEVLFDGTKATLDKRWRPGARITADGLLMEGCTSIDTFGDYSMHLEFRLPFMPEARGQGRGNSGLYHQGRYETQVLDSFGLEGKDNEAGGLYSIRDPDLNMCLPPMQWQTYDVDFTAARFDTDGNKTANARITVKLNGVVVHRNVELPHSTTAAPLKEGPEDGPIHLQDHGNPVRFRNIWVLPRDIDSEAKRPIVSGFERFHREGVDLVEGGRLLLGELNCVACHQAASGLAPWIQAKQAPILDDVGERLRPEWMIEFIANPHDVKPGTTMPDLMSQLNPQQRRQAATAITNFLVGSDTTKAGGQSGDSRKGERLFHLSGCVACHSPRDGRGTSAVTSVPLVGLEDKYTRGSLEAFLENPLAVRPSGRMPHIDLGRDGARHVAQYLTGDLSVSFSGRRPLPKEPNLEFAAYYLSVDQLPDLDKLTPDKTGVARGLDISVGERDENVVIRFSGYLPIKKTGNYTFRLASDDGSRLYIDGEKVIDNDGIHPVIVRENTLRLRKGSHEFRVDWFEQGGGEELTLDWDGPGVVAGPIDQSLVISRDGSPAPEVAPPSPADTGEFAFDEAKVEQGRQLFVELGCAACHVRTEHGNPIRWSAMAPALADCRPGKGCLDSSPIAPVPNYDLTGVQSESIAAAIQASPPSHDQADAATLVQTMKSLNCYACHRRDGLGGSESDRNEFFVSTIPEMGDEGRLPPPLDGVGDKLQENWIKHVVSNGDKSRPYMRTYMPKFGEHNAGHLAAIFAAIDATYRSGHCLDRRTGKPSGCVGSKNGGCRRSWLCQLSHLRPVPIHRHSGDRAGHHGQPHPGGLVPPISAQSQSLSTRDSDAQRLSRREKHGDDYLRRGCQQTDRGHVGLSQPGHTRRRAGRNHRGHDRAQGGHEASDLSKLHRRGFTAWNCRRLLPKKPTSAGTPRT